MNDAMRLVLLLVIAAVLLTAGGALLARWMDPQRRLTRYLRQALGAEPEAVMMSRGLGRALAFNIDAGKIAVLWDGGRKGLVYRLDQLMGGEMMVDHAVICRVHRQDGRIPLNEIPMGAHRAVLRLVFDNPRDPEYELELWPSYVGRSHEHVSPADAIQAGRKWLTGLDSLLRLPKASTAPVRTLTKPAAPVPVLPDEDDDPPPPWDDDEEAAR
jgi:hypothetical protein